MADLISKSQKIFIPALDIGSHIRRPRSAASGSGSEARADAGRRRLQCFVSQPPRVVVGQVRGRGKVRIPVEGSIGREKSLPLGEVRVSSNQHVDNLEPLSRESYQLSPGLRRFHWVNKNKREEPSGDLAGAACKNSTAKLVVYPVGAFAAWSCIGHVFLAWVTRRGQRGTCYHPRRMRAAQIGLIGTLTER